MSSIPPRALEMSVSIALRDALAATRRAFIPLGLVVTALAIIPIVGPLLSTPLLVTAALRDLRDGAPLSVGDTFSAFGSRLGEFLTTWLVTLLVGIAAAIGFVIALFVVGIAALLAAGSAPGASAGAELLLGGGLVALFVGLVVYVGLRLSFIYYAAYDGKGAFSAFSQSWTLSQGNVLRIFGWGLVAAVVSALLFVALLFVAVVLSLLLPALGPLLSLLLLSLGGTAGLMINTRMMAILYLGISSVALPAPKAAAARRPTRRSK